jgi:hypothetical protein
VLRTRPARRPVLSAAVAARSDVAAPARREEWVVVVCRAGRAATEAALAEPLRAVELRVAFAVVKLTVMWSKLEECIALADLGTEAGIGGSEEYRSKEVGRAVRRLAQLGIVTYTPGDGRGHVSRIGLPRAPDPGAELVTQGGTPPPPPSNDKKGGGICTQRGDQMDPKGGGGGVPANEYYRENNPPPTPPEPGGEAAAPDRQPPRHEPGAAAAKPVRRRRPPDPVAATQAAQRAIAERNAAERAAAPPPDPDALERLRAARHAGFGRAAPDGPP